MAVAAGAPAMKGWRLNLPVLSLAVYFLTSMIYVLPPGMPQPADLLLILGIAASLACSRANLPDEPVLYLATSLLVAWIVLVNALWFLMIGDAVFLRKTAFYLYNALVLVFVISIGFRDVTRLMRAVWLSALVALFLQAAYLGFLWAGSRLRATGTFNNPNQMGYWALLMMTCMVVAKGRARLYLTDLLAIGAGLYTVALSLSKAASLAAMLLLGLIALTRRRWPGLAVLLVPAALVVALMVELAVGGLVEKVQDLKPVAALTHRLESIGEQEDDSLGHRGYARLFENPHYLAFGAGEGVFERLNSERRVQEFHSSLGNILMSYGVVGLALFGALLLFVVSQAAWTVQIYLLPIMLYGVTHMGLRESLFWVFLGLVYAQARYGQAGGDHPPHGVLHRAGRQRAAPWRSEGA